MEIKTFKKLKDNRYRIKLDNDEVITLYDDVIVEYNLLVNKDLDDKKLEEILKSNSKKDAYYIALKLLNTKMRTKKEISKKLNTSGYDEDTTSEVIKKLYDEGYLNDSRYIKAYLNDQVNLTDKGPLKIKRELSNLGFREEIIINYLTRISDDVWGAKIDKYVTKKLKSTTNLSATSLKFKIIHDLVNKGHYKDLIMTLIENYEFKNSEEVLKREYNKIRTRLEAKYEGNELRFYLKAKLLNKGFTSEEIERLIKGEE